jgi:hypothetical protein
METYRLVYHEKTGIFHQCRKEQHVTDNDEQHVTGNDEQHVTAYDEQHVTGNDE